MRAQRERYGRRRAVLRAALASAGLRVDRSEAGLYLWATRDEDCWSTVDWFARHGILVAPGTFYGPAGGRHVRVALTGLDEQVDAAAARLATPRPAAPRHATPSRAAPSRAEPTAH